MAVHSGNEALMCKVFLSSLALVAMRWFDVLEERSLRSFEKSTRAFGARFMTCSKVPKPFDYLLSIAMREDGDFEDVEVRTFRVGLSTEHELRKSLTMKFALSMRELLDRINQYKQVEEDQTQGKGKVKAFPEKKDPRGGGYHNNRSRRDFPN
ncbi:uncharacterized protein LOC112038211 [Quercus suber]|uniref:uncharacterized protein LOC112038211 n=1 Tax=Quercus suber TaxID=58331 RepID=UPI000CE2253E|nr:uncharacterized protein LOC112038211 [Quercus suber]